MYFDLKIGGLGNYHVLVEIIHIRAVEPITQNQELVREKDFPLAFLDTLQY